MPKADKKQRHKAKRDAKRQAARRRQSVSPFKRLADAPGEPECWISDGLDVLGQAGALVFKRGAGLTGVAGFLVDRGVVGLKDAWSRVGVERGDFEKMLQASRDDGLPTRRATLDEVRRIVAGGARWAHDNGMRLPKDWLKTASLIGGVGDWMSADVSTFVREFVGHPMDLQQRLIGEPLDSYLERPDVQFVFDDGAPFEDQDTGEYVDGDEFDDEGDEFDDDDDDADDGDADDGDIDDFEDEDSDDDDSGDDAALSVIDELGEVLMKKVMKRMTPGAATLAGETGSWLRATRRDEPSPELVEAWKAILCAAMLSEAAMPDAPMTETMELGDEILSAFAQQVEPSRSNAYQHAIEQALEHLKTGMNALEELGIDPGVLDDLDADDEG